MLSCFKCIRISANCKIETLGAFRSDRSLGLRGELGEILRCTADSPRALLCLCFRDCSVAMQRGTLLRAF